MNEKDLLFANNNYVETNSYKCVGGTQSRTIEAWIKTSNGEGEICSWGRDFTGEKWVFRLTAGRLRVEISGAGFVGNTYVNDNQ